jgi:hypothetical protein
MQKRKCKLLIVDETTTKYHLQTLVYTGAGDFAVLINGKCDGA